MSNERLMTLKPEVRRVLSREKMVCDAAIARLKEKCRPLEQRYGWTTQEFMEKFNSGEAGDDQEFFQWYALAEAVKDWQKTRDSLEELLAGSELMNA
ncbi:MAG: hypothetical protein ACP5Q3_10905 [bacterium]